MSTKTLKSRHYLASLFGRISLVAFLSSCAATSDEEPIVPPAMGDSSEVGDKAEQSAVDDAEGSVDGADKALREYRCCAYKSQQFSPVGAEETMACWGLGEVTKVRAAAQCTMTFAPYAGPFEISSLTVRNGKCNSYDSCKYSMFGVF